uniref:CD59b antigen n=2 Tax=Mus musculus TaxID=10090 RepID=A2BI28_MOUSE
MRAQRGLILLLLLLAVFCSTAVSLKCYNCLDPVSSCKINTTCSPNLDSCLYAVAGAAQHSELCILVCDRTNSVWASLGAESTAGEGPA